MAVSWWKCKYAKIIQATNLDISTVLIGFWRPGGLQVKYWFSVYLVIWKYILILMKECFNNRIYELPARMRTRRQKAKDYSFHVLLCGLTLETVAVIWGGYYKKISYRYTQLLGYIISEVLKWQPILPIAETIFMNFTTQ